MAYATSYNFSSCNSEETSEYLKCEKRLARRGSALYPAGKLTALLGPLDVWGGLAVPYPRIAAASA